MRPVASGSESKVSGRVELAGAEDPRVARQDLLDERRARPRQAHDEHRPLRLQADPRTRAKNSGVKAAINRSTNVRCASGS